MGVYEYNLMLFGLPPSLVALPNLLSVSTLILVNTLCMEQQSKKGLRCKSIAVQDLKMMWIPARSSWIGFSRETPYKSEQRM